MQQRRYRITAYMIPVSVKNKSFQASPRPAVQRQKLLSTSRLGALQTYLPTGNSSPEKCFFSRTPVSDDQFFSPLSHVLNIHLKIHTHVICQQCDMPYIYIYIYMC